MVFRVEVVRDRLKRLEEVLERLRIDPARVHEYLETELDGLDDFVAQVATWLAREA